MWGDFAITFVLGFIISFMATPYTMKIANKIGAVDIPKDNRRMHKKTMPKFGGPAIILGFILATVYMLVNMSLDKTINLFGPNKFYLKLIGFLLGIIILAMFTIVDDIKTIKPLTKLLGQTLAAIVIVAFGIKIDDIHYPFLHNYQIINVVNTFVTIIWIIGVTNAINLIDGLDGLSTGITAIAATSLLIIFILNGSTVLSILLITALVGSLLGFLPFNYGSARTFLGDTGSNFLGFAISVISILGVAKTYTLAVIVLPMIVLGLPLIDTIWAIIRRIAKGKSIKAVFKADKGHLHHRLIKLGLSQRQAVLVLYALAAFFGIFAIILYESGFLKALSFFVMVLIAVCLGYRNFADQEKDNSEKYECIDCKYIYNPKYGNETQKIKPGTDFKDLPDTWVCPVCGESKDRFVGYVDK